MGFASKYTTAEKVAADTSIDKKEKDKTSLSNDAFALGELLETLTNVMGWK